VAFGIIIPALFCTSSGLSKHCRQHTQTRTQAFSNNYMIHITLFNNMYQRASNYRM